MLWRILFGGAYFVIFIDIESLWCNNVINSATSFPDTFLSATLTYFQFSDTKTSVSRGTGTGVPGSTGYIVCFLNVICLTLFLI